MARTRETISATGQALVVFGVGVPVVQPAVAQIAFEESARFPVASDVTSVAVADMNGDGRPDIIFTESQETLRLYENRGQDQFVRIGSIYQPGMDLGPLVAADLVNNGSPDLIWISLNQGYPNLNVYYNDGSGRHGRIESTPLSVPYEISSCAAGELTTDRRPDLVLAGGYRDSGNAPIVIFHNVNGRFEQAQQVALPGSECTDMVVGDMDGDGDVDVAAIVVDSYFNYEYAEWKIYSSELRIYLNDGSGLIAGQHIIELPYGKSGDEDPFPEAVRVADFDGDGDRDVVVAATVRGVPSDSIRFLPIENIQDEGRFELRPEVSFGSGRDVCRLTVGDLDTDGDIDVLLNGLYEIWLFDNSGDMTFDPPRQLHSVLRSAPPAIADLNNDGQLDLAFGSYRDVTVLTNTTPINGPRLDQTPLIRGQQTTFTVTEAQPGETVHFLYSQNEAGNSLGRSYFGGIMLDLLDPIRRIGSAHADDNGVAVVEVTVPQNAPLRTVTTQAVIRRGENGELSVKTPFRQSRIIE